MTTIPGDTDLGIDLYWEAQGSGPAVLLIPGTPGDAGQMAAFADELAVDHLVVTYDRRGTSRSSRPEGWSQTSVPEQADDAASVLSRVGVQSALVFGTSNGAAVALELALRHPGRVSRAIVHELPLLSVLEDPTPVASTLGSMIGTAMEAGGPRAALDRFLRFAFSDAIVDDWPTDLRERMLSNAELALNVELPAFQAYRPDAELLAGCRVPVTVLVGEDQHLPFFHEAAGWLADALGTHVRSAPGAHGPQFSAPARLAAAVRDIEAGESSRR
jgi:pimeloyl-ACP methyl ester carboxylesterase